MGATDLAQTLSAAILLTASQSAADTAGRVEPLDGTHSITSSTTELGNPSERSPQRPVPQGDASPPHMAPSGGPVPPNQLTPAPVLPFNPNRSLMPPPSSPPPSSRSGGAGR